jgi:endonuclease/exonuclease/phosphatase family metal-dependent hydrolase
MIIILLVVVVILILLAAAPLASHRALGDYTDPNGPIYTGAYAGEAGDFDGSLRVVSWNLFYGAKLEQAIAALETAPELRDADVLFFQEIDRVGVETIAQRLHYNYVFYPTILDHHRRIEYGDAILSKWPLSDPTKIVLPIFLPGWLESRSSTRATLTAGGREITLYSTHLDLTWMIFRRGESQAEFLSRAAGGKDDWIILGGDFNTWYPASIVNLDRQMGKIGLERLSKGAGYTFEWAGLKAILDHIYSNAGLEVRSGVYRQTDASDHYPVWAEMSLAIR